MKVYSCEESLLQRLLGLDIRLTQKAPASDAKMAAIKFTSAGLAGCWADICTFPFDTAKVRLQVQGQSITDAGANLALKYRGVFGTLYTVAKEEGLLAIYNGLVPGLQRQFAFCTVRIGCYDSVKEFYTQQLTSDNHVNNGVRIMAGMTTGALAVSLAQPTEVVKIRMQAQTRGTAVYRGSIHAYRHIGHHEGVSGLWRGVGPNIARTAVVNCCEIVVYDILKDQILSRRLLPDNIVCHFSAALGAGFVTAVVSSPVDVVKTRYMNSKRGEYRSVGHCVSSAYHERGLKAFYKGFVPNFLRLSTWNIAMFVTYEFLQTTMHSWLD